MKDARYDRQLRLWGEEGQASIESASVCVLGSSALATEILKSLVLAGINSFCILDDALVQNADLGNNFFLHVSDLGRKRGEATLAKLKELNPAVGGTWEDVSLEEWHDERMLYRLSSFSVVVASNLRTSTAAAISDYLFENSIPFISCRVFGLIGYIRVSVREHTVANAHEENPREDLRLDRPLPEFQAMVDGTDLAELSVDEIRHTPYIILYMKALKMYREELSDPSAFPESFADRKALWGLIETMRVETDTGSTDAENFDEAKTKLLRSFQKTTVPARVVEILNDAKCSSSSTCTQPFWIICTGLRKFVEKHNCLPLKGNLPDMTSDSKRYARLANIYHSAAVQDAREVYQFIREVERERGADSVISEEMCYRFCKTADSVHVQRGSKISAESDAGKIIEFLAEENGDAQKKAAAEWLLLLLAADRFLQEKGRCVENCNFCTIKIRSHPLFCSKKNKLKD
ncbi:hypothetical protein WR25_18391 isoform A [Diploscapter pachys]|uniref:NEDD8-activating enzyme E1 regulatory subunit n=1 Tax=Diploscapter pachys TaxID=2018661 RepID=A0A2A2JZK1_9BILA|nr:hypothetical protein WR25_18391 isoform A [Diploscapter pachys]